MTTGHQEQARDPVCPECGHRHHWREGRKDPCWVLEDREMCKHAPQCIFCKNGIQHDDGHQDLQGGLYIHEQCKKHVPPEQRQTP